MSVDYSKYLEVCKYAVTDNWTFNNFRRHPSYQRILEHHDMKEIGQKYLDNIVATNPKILKNIKTFQANDKLGNPEVFKYDIDGVKYNVSPTTLRYISILSDIMTLHLELKSYDIVEIGVGYGGLCRLINNFALPWSYTLVDLPEVLELAKKYLAHFSMPENRIDFVELKDLKPREYDLCISNYAFTEINRLYQNKYKKLIIDNSKHGYLTCNFINGRDSYSPAEVKSMKRNYTILPEIPLTAPDNFIYTW
jgi:putative sugar O-methyltransferase